MKEGDEADAMYFIVVGALEVLVNEGQLRVATLRQSQYFGESGLLKPISGDLPKRNATIRTLMFCELRLLLMDEFDRIVLKFPATLQNIRDTSKRREKQTNDTARRRSLNSFDAIRPETPKAVPGSRPGKRRGSTGTNMDNVESISLGCRSSAPNSPERSYSNSPEPDTGHNLKPNLEEVGGGKLAGTNKIPKRSAGEVTILEAINANENVHEMNVGPEVDRRKSAGTDKSPKEPRLAGDVTILEAIQAPETPGRRSQLKPIPVKKRRPFSVRAESTKHLTQPVRLRNEKIKTVPDLALSVTRWQAGMNAK